MVKQTNRANMVHFLKSNQSWGDGYNERYQQWQISNNCDQCDFASSWTNSLKAHLKTHSGAKSKKCNHCEYTLIRPEHFKGHIWNHTVGTSLISVHILIMPPLIQPVWRTIWKCTAERGQTNAINVTFHLLGKPIWGHIWKYTVEKVRTNAINVSMPQQQKSVWKHIWRK